KGRAVPPHVDLAGQSLDDVNARVAALRLGFVTRRQGHPARALVRAMERVGLEHLALEEVFVVAPLWFVEPGWQLWHDATIGSGCHTMRLGGGRSLTARLPRSRMGAPRSY